MGIEYGKIRLIMFGGILVIFAVGFLLTRKEQLLLPREEAAWYRRPVRRLAVGICRRLLRSGTGGAASRLTAARRKRLEEDLRVLYPRKNAKRSLISYEAGKAELLLTVLLAAAAASFLTAAQGLSERKETEVIERESAGGKTQQIRLTEQQYGDFDITVEPLRLTKEQLEVEAEKLFRILPGVMAGDNSDLAHVSTALALPSSVEGSPFELVWESVTPDVISSRGEPVFAPDRDEPRRNGVLQVTAAAQSAENMCRFVHAFDVTVEDPGVSAEEQAQLRIAGALRKAEEESRTKAAFRLPAEAGGVMLTFLTGESDASVPLFLAALIAGVALFFGKDHDLRSKIGSRERQMAVDYPQIVSKLVLYLGAGVSMRGAFAKIAEAYRSGAMRGGEERYAYEEIVLMCHELDSGISEASAYAHFGLRCRSRRYTKLCSLLTQNLRRGNDALLAALQEEAQEAGEYRRLLAKQMGEEAGTKLLAPMMIMLTVTLVMIMVPAYIGFQM